VAAAIALVAAPAGADSWLPYGARREVDPTGRWSVVLRAGKQGVSAEFTFAEAPAGAPAVTPVAPGAPFAPNAPEVNVREGDAILATGTLESAPLEVRVSARGLGFAAMEEYGGVGGGVSFAWVGRDGSVRHPKRLGDLFSAEEIQAFRHTVSSIWWFRGAFIDEDARETIVVGVGRAIRAVSIETGVVRKAGAAEIRRALRFADPQAAALAIDLARELALDGVEDALAATLTDEHARLRLRVRAAAALAERKDLRGRAVLVAAAATPKPATVEKADYEFALEHLPAVLGLDAVPLLQAAMRGESADGWSAGMNGFVALGEPAVAALLAMLTEAGQSSDYRGGAAHALGRMGSKASIAGLVAALADPQEYVANAAANAVLAVGKASIAKDLVALLDKPTTQDGRLSSYFEEVKEPSSVAPLVRCLVRHPKDEYPRNVILRALVFQTGVDVGAETSAWQAWLAKQPR
jgi:hypothetical protein